MTSKLQEQSTTPQKVKVRTTIKREGKTRVVYLGNCMVGTYYLGKSGKRVAHILLGEHRSFLVSSFASARRQINQKIEEWLAEAGCIYTGGGGS